MTDCHGINWNAYNWYISGDTGERLAQLVAALEKRGVSYKQVSVKQAVDNIVREGNEKGCHCFKSNGYESDNEFRVFILFGDDEYVFQLGTDVFSSATYFCEAFSEMIRDGIKHKCMH